MKRQLHIAGRISYHLQHLEVPEGANVPSREHQNKDFTSENTNMHTSTHRHTNTFQTPILLNDLRKGSSKKSWRAAK